MFIYMITNLINDKKYIGLTKNSIKERYYHHCRKAVHGGGFYLHSALRKYGVENFKIEKLDEASDIEELKQKEIEYIEKYNTFNNGYNLTKGGDFSSNEGMVVVKDETGNVKRISSEEFQENQDKYTSVNLGLITIYKDDEKMRVPSSEYKEIYYEMGWRSRNFGFVTVKTKDGKITKIPVSEFDKNIHTGINTGTQTYFNIITEKFVNISPDDVDLDIHYNKSKKQYHIFDSSNTLVLKTNSFSNIPKELGSSQFGYMVERDKENSTFIITEELLGKLKIKKRNYDLLNYKLIIKDFDRDVNKL